MSKAVGIQTSEGVEWHAPGVVHDYATLCGMDGNDHIVDQLGVVQPARGQKITCSTCAAIFRELKGLKLTERDFA